MGAWRGKTGDRLIVFAAVVLTAVMAPGARAWMVIPTTQSLEAQIASADVVIRGRIMVAPGGDRAVRVIEALKGEPPAGSYVLVVTRVSPLQWELEKGGLFVLWRNGAEYVAERPRDERMMIRVRRVGTFSVDATSMWLWEPQGRQFLAGTAPAYAMDGRALTTPDELMAAARAAAAFPAESRARQRSTYLNAADFPRNSPLALVPTGRLNVPIDGRLEHLAHAWLDESDVRYRARAAEVLAYFPSSENRRRLRALLHDPGYELADAPSWEPARARRVLRQYPARKAAAWALEASSDPAVLNGVQTTAPHAAYRPVRWGAVLLAILGTLAIAVAAGRRGGAGRRVFIWGAVAATAWVLAVGLRSRWAGESIGWSLGGASYEVVATAGRVWLLRVADGSPAAGVAVRSEHVVDADARPWFAGMLNWGGGVSALRVQFERGVVSKSALAYQMIRAPLWMFAIVPALVPLGAAVVWMLRRARRRRRLRRGQCGACGYDLRGSVGRRRCPECGGAFTTPSPPPAASP